MAENVTEIGPLPPLSESDRQMYLGGIGLFILAEAMIFVTLFSTRFLLAGTERLVEPSSPTGLAITFALVISLIPAFFAHRSIVNGETMAMARNLLFTAALAIIAIAIIIYDWSTMPFAAGSAFGENYIIATGYHAVHILIGAVWLFAASVAGRKGIYTEENHWVVSGGVLFWFFVVAVWLVLYAVFFIA